MHRLSNTVETLAECAQRMKQLTGQLAELLQQSDSRAGNATQIASALDDMLDNLNEQFRLEEEHDYLADVLEQYPTWHPQVEQLQREEQLLQRHLQEARDRIARESTDGCLSRESRRQLIDWLDAYHNHVHRETRLVQEAFTLEVGQGE